MNLRKHYQDLHNSSIRRIERGEYHIDPYLKAPVDNRFGISLVIRPSPILRCHIQHFQERLQHIDASQYYYPNSDMHITVLSIISCYEGFSLDQIFVPDYIDLVRQSLQGIGKFRLGFQGVAVTDSGILIRGYPEGEHLSELRNQLRKNFSTSPLEQSIDKRYVLQTAHATVLRFQAPLQHKNAFLKEMEIHTNRDFGSFEVNELELVFTDWYSRERNSVSLEQFKLKEPETLRS